MIKKWIVAPFSYKTLFWGFVHQEIKARYAGSIGGLLWSILTPLINMLIYFFVFSVILKIKITPADTGTDSFVIYLLAGLLPWTAFSDTISSSPAMFLGKANLITKVAFPLEVVPIAGVLVIFILDGMGFGLFLVYLTIKGYASMSWLFLPVVTAMFAVFALGFEILIASLSVFIRDIQQILASILTIWMYITPIIYPAKMSPPFFQPFLQMNPAYAFIELYHQILLQNTVSYQLLGQAVICAMLSFLCGIWFYERSRKAFADVL